MLSKIKSYLKWIVIGLIILLAATCFFQYKSNQALRSKYDISTANEKSLLNRLNKNGEEIIEYQATITMLKHTGDSTIQHLLEQQEKLKVKNKELQTMISMASQFHVHDTLRLHDTIFRDPNFALDTCFTDEWKNVCLDMKYPGEICVDATMKSQKDVYVTATRETIDPPSKCFFIRWFQKKHTITRVIINEENPYIENHENLYIRVLDD